MRKKYRNDSHRTYELPTSREHPFFLTFHPVLSRGLTSMDDLNYTGVTLTGAIRTARSVDQLAVRIRTARSADQLAVRSAQHDR